MNEDSGSMEPAFYRGDLLFLYQSDGRKSLFEDDGATEKLISFFYVNIKAFEAGEIVVFKLEGRDIPIVHRILRAHEYENGTVQILTKGDNNNVDDRALYPGKQLWLERKHIIGRAKGYVLISISCCWLT